MSRPGFCCSYTYVDLVKTHKYPLSHCWCFILTADQDWWAPLSSTPGSSWPARSCRTLAELVWPASLAASWSPGCRPWSRERQGHRCCGSRPGSGNRPRVAGLEAAGAVPRVGQLQQHQPPPADASNHSASIPCISTSSTGPVFPVFPLEAQSQYSLYFHYPSTCTQAAAAKQPKQSLNTAHSHLTAHCTLRTTHTLHTIQWT